MQKVVPKDGCIVSYVQTMLQGKLLFWNVFVLILSSHFFLKSGFAHRCVLKRFYALHNIRKARVYDPLCSCARVVEGQIVNHWLAKMALLRILDLSHLTCVSQTNLTVKQHAKIRHSAYRCVVKRTSDYHSRNYLAFPLLRTFSVSILFEGNVAYKIINMRAQITQYMQLYYIK